MVRNKKNGSLNILLIFILIITLDLVFLYFIKYNNQSLSIKQFNFTNIGNLLNFISYFFLLIGLILCYTLKDIEFNYKIFFVILTFNQIFIVGAYFSGLITLPFEKYYYLGQNGNRLFTGLLFTLYQFSQFSLIFYIWLIFNKAKSFLFIRSLLNSAIVMFLILIFSFLYIIAKENSFKENIILESKKNIAVVFGAAVWSNDQPSPSLAARVDKAIDLLDEGKVYAIYLTGSNAPGELSESEVAFRYIQRKRKNTSNIFKENKTTSTAQQIQFIKTELLSNKIQNNIFVISDSYHLVRIKEISNFDNFTIQVVPSGLSLSFENALYFKFREALALTVFWFFAY